MQQATLNATPALSCKFCSNPRKEIFVKAKGMTQKDGSIKYICPKCEYDEQLTARVSTKHLHNIYAKASEKAKDALICIPEYKEIKEIHKCFIDYHKEVYLKRFKEYELLAIKNLLSAREHYFASGITIQPRNQKEGGVPLMIKSLHRLKSMTIDTFRNI